MKSPIKATAPKSMARSRVAWLIPCIAALIPSSANAGSDKFFSVWTVEPSRIDSQILTINEGDFVQKARLLPISLIEADGDVRAGPDNVQIATKGDQFFELSAGNPFRPKASGSAVFCRVNPTKGVSKGLLGTSEFLIQYCVVDTDKNGLPESAFVTYGCFRDFPIVQTKIPKGKDLWALESAPFKVIAKTEVRDGPTVGISYFGTGLLRTKPSFIQAFGSGAAIPLFGEGHTKSGDTPDQWQSFGGAAFTVLGKEGKALKVRNDRPIPAQPFSMYSTGTC